MQEEEITAVELDGVKAKSNFGPKQLQRRNIGGLK